MLKLKVRQFCSSCIFDIMFIVDYDDFTIGIKLFVSTSNILKSF